MNRVLIWRSIIFQMNLPKSTWCHPSFQSAFAGLQRGNFANVLGVTYFPRTSLNPLRVKSLFLEALSLSSSWRFSDATWPHSARASLGGSSACESPKSLIDFPNPARLTIILCDVIVSYVHCTVRRSWHATIRECGHERHRHDRPSGEMRGGERRALGFVLRWFGFLCHLLIARTQDNKYLD